MATLFSKSKGGAAEKKQLLDLLTFVVTATRSEAGSALVPKVFADKIEKLEPGLIQPKAGAEVDPAGNIAVYATSKGVAAILGDEAAAAAPAPSATEPKSEFTLESGIELPVSKRGGIKADIYPFAKMSIGQSFFVPATENKPNPAKTLASTCSSASKRFAKVYPEGHAQAGQPTGKDGRKFVVRKVEVDGKVTGARCFCIAG